jgi:hypothetical protein
VYTGFNLYRPHREEDDALDQHELEQRLERLQQVVRAQVVALQVAFERQTLKPVFHLIGYRLWV